MTTLNANALAAHYVHDLSTEEILRLDLDEAVEEITYHLSWAATASELDVLRTALDVERDHAEQEYCASLRTITIPIVKIGGFSHRGRVDEGNPLAAVIARIRDLDAAALPPTATMVVCDDGPVLIEMVGDDLICTGTAEALEELGVEQAYLDRLRTVTVPMEAIDLDDADHVYVLDAAAELVMRHRGIEPQPDDDNLGLSHEDALLDADSGPVLVVGVPAHGEFELTGTPEALEELGVELD